MCVCACAWMIVSESFPDMDLAVKKRSSYQRQAKLNHLNFSSFPRSHWVISSLSLARSSSFWCSSRFYLTVFVLQFYQFFLIVNQRTFLTAHNKKRTYKKEYSGINTSCTSIAQTSVVSVLLYIFGMFLQKWGKCRNYFVAISLMLLIGLKLYVTWKFL